MKSKRRFDVKTPSAVVLVASLMFACGISGYEPGGYQPPPDAAAPATPGPDEPVSSIPDGSRSNRAPGKPQRVRPRPGMANVHPIAWERARPVRGGRALSITYWSGVEPCNVLDHVEVRYGSRKITLTLHEGHDPDQADTACIELAVQKVVQVKLDQAVGDRKIVDGAA